MYQLLIIDDKKEFLKLPLFNAIKKLPIEYQFYSGNENNIHEYTEEKNIDLIIADCVSQYLENGLNIIRSLTTGYTPVIIYSENISEEIKIKCYQAGVSDYIVKPSNEMELFYKLKTYLKQIQALRTLDRYNERLEEIVEDKVRTINHTNNVIIYTLANLVETRETTSGEHLENISFFSRVISEVLSKDKKYRKIINQQFLRNITLASALHDIGKIGIRDSVLLKPGKLTEDQFEYIKLHTTIGGKVLEECKKKIGSSDYIDMAIDIAYYHHERYNGTGYNKGLKGEEIPLSARIVTLADVYDAMTSIRVYKKKISHEETVNYIKTERNGHFDPAVVDAFFEIEEVFKKYKENQ